MKKLLLVFVGLLCSLVISAQTNFQELSLEKAREQARAENKPIFLDCYTSWCGPCKMMANDVFTLEAAGNYFNKNFVCVKIDMEKGEGPAIGKQYEVDAYPTLKHCIRRGNWIKRSKWHTGDCFLFPVRW